MLMARFDGGCNPNPRGHAACACMIYRKEGEVYRQSVYLGHGEGQTNNVAEYAGLKLILEYLLEHPEECVIKGDSRVVINRMANKYTDDCGTGTCVAVAAECKQIMKKMIYPVRFVWERRCHNDDCDEMCKREIQAARNRLREWRNTPSYLHP